MDGNFLEESIENEQNKPKTSWELILDGRAPKEIEDLNKISEGIGFVLDFLEEKYLDEYICEGGSKMKFVTGRRGSGKSHLVNMMSERAKEKAYVTASFSAKDIWLHDFKEIYLEIIRQCDLMECLKGCANQIIKNMGYDPGEIKEGSTFADYLSGIGEGDPITKREIRQQLREMFWENPHMDNNFALACSQLTGYILGHPVLEEQNKDILLKWLYCDKTVRLLNLRALGLSPSRITRYNARNMLRSLSEVVRLAAFSGILVTIDDMEVLCDRSSMQPMRYTKVRREDAYESIRQLIDEIDTMKNIMFMFSFDRELIDNDNFGIKSYQALWMRIQNEVAGERFNRFADIIDLDRAGKDMYDCESIVRMSRKLCDFAGENGRDANSIDSEMALEIINNSRTGSVGIPLEVNRLSLGISNGGGDDV